jgi:hypothetical protein
MSPLEARPFCLIVLALPQGGGEGLGKPGGTRTRIIVTGKTTPAGLRKYGNLDLQVIPTDVLEYGGRGG